MFDYFDQTRRSPGTVPYDVPRAPVRSRGTGEGLAALRQQLATTAPVSKPSTWYRAWMGNQPYDVTEGRRTATGALASRAGVPDAAYESPGPPLRFDVKPFDTGLQDFLAGPVGVGAGLSPASAPRGGTMDVMGQRLATVPVTAQNFGTYAREGVLSAITSVLGHEYQQTEGLNRFGGPGGEPDVVEDSPLDWMIGRMIDVGNAVFGVFDGLVTSYRDASAINRGRAVRSLYRNEYVMTNMIDKVTTELFSGGTKFAWDKILAQAQRDGVTPMELVGQLYDLDDAQIMAIAANPNMSDQQLEALVKGTPFSRDPMTNLALELGVNLGLFLIPGMAAPRAAAFGKGVLGGLGVAQSPLAATRGAGIAMGAARAGGVTLKKVWQLNGLLLSTGTAVRAGEWAVKQMGVALNNEELVAAADRWLWEMPLSNNPGLQILDAFSVYPIRGLKSSIAELRKGNLPLAEGINVPLRRPTISIGGREVVVPKKVADRLGKLADTMTLDDMQTRIFDRLGWRPDLVRRAFADEGSELSVDDLRNTLVYFALALARNRTGEAAMYEGLHLGVVGRSEEWVRNHVREAVQILEDTMAGKDDGLIRLIREEWWERGALLSEDAAAALEGAQGFIGPYAAETAFSSMATWTRVSKMIAKAVQAGEAPAETVAALRTDVNVDFVRAFKRHLETAYPDEKALVSVEDLNRLRTMVPSISRYGRGIVARRGNAIPSVTRKRLMAVLDEAVESQAKANAEAMKVPTQKAGVVKPGEEGSAPVVARATGVPTDAVRILIAGADETTVPPDGIVKWVAKLMGRTPTDVRAMAPEDVWQVAREAFERRLAEAAERGTVLDAVERFGRWLFARDAKGGTKASALDRESTEAIASYLMNPPTPDALRASPSLAQAHTQFLADATELAGELAAVLDDPARNAKLVDVAGTPVVVPDTVTPDDLNRLAALMQRLAQAPGTPDLEVQTLTAPGIHPFEKIPVLTAAAAEGRLRLVTAERMLLDKLGGGLEALRPLLVEALGEEAVAAGNLTELLATLTSRAASLADSAAQLRDRLHRLAMVSDMDPRTTGLSDDLVTLINDAAAEVGDAQLGHGGWRTVPVGSVPAPAGPDIPTLERVLGIGALRARVAELGRLRDNLGGGKLAATLEAGGWEPVGGKGFSVRKMKAGPAQEAARAEAARIAADTGLPTGIARMGDRWVVFRRTPGESPDAPPAAPAMEPDMPSTPPPDDLGPIDPEFVARREAMNAAFFDAQPAPDAPGAPEAPGVAPDAAFDVRAAYEQFQADIAAAIAGGPRPLEFVDGNLRKLLTEDPREPGAWRITTLDADGTPLGHIEVASFDEGIREARQTLRREQFLAGVEGQALEAPAPEVLTPEASVPRPWVQVLDEGPPALAWHFTSPVRGQLVRQFTSTGDETVLTAIADALAAAEPWLRENVSRISNVDLSQLQSWFRPHINRADMKVRRERDEKGWIITFAGTGESAGRKVYEDIGSDGRMPGHVPFPTKEAALHEIARRQAAAERMDRLEQEVYPRFARIVHLETLRRAGELGNVEAATGAPAPFGTMQGQWGAARYGPGAPGDAAAAAYAIPEFRQRSLHRALESAKRDLAAAETDAQRAWQQQRVGWVERDLAEFYEAFPTYRARDPEAPITAEPWEPLGDQGVPVPVPEERELPGAMRWRDELGEAQITQLRGAFGAIDRADAGSIDNFATVVAALDEGGFDVDALRDAVEGYTAAALDIQGRLAKMKPAQRKAQADALREELDEAWQELADLITDLRPGTAAETPRGAPGIETTGELPITREATWRSEGDADWRLEAASLQRRIDTTAGPFRAEAERITEAMNRLQPPGVAINLSKSGAAKLKKLKEDLAANKAAREASIAAIYPRVEVVNGIVWGADTGRFSGQVLDALASLTDHGRTRLIDELAATGTPERPVTQGSVVEEINRRYGDGTLIPKPLERPGEQLPSAGDATGAVTEPAPAPVVGSDTVFRSEIEAAPDVPARFRLVELDDLLTSDAPAYPKELQLRARGRKESAAQVDKIARTFRADDALRSENGWEGAQIVRASDAAVVSGNGRTMAMRKLADEQFAVYRGKLRERAGEFGLTPEQVDAMRRPVLVREIDDAIATPDLARRLNEATGGATLAEKATAVAYEISAGDLAALDISAAGTVESALRTLNGKTFVRRVFGKLSASEQRSLIANDELTDGGMRLIKAAMLSKVIGSGDVVQRLVDRAEDTPIGKVRNGLMEAIGQLATAKAFIEEGARFANLDVTDDLGRAIRWLDEVREGKGDPMVQLGLAEAEVRGGTQVSALFSRGDLTPQQAWLAEVLWRLGGQNGSAKQVREFLQAYANRVIDSEDPRQMSLFGGEPDLTGFLRAVVNDINDARIARAEADGGLFGAQGVEQVPLPPDEAGNVQLSPASETPTGTLRSPAQASQPILDEAGFGDEIMGRVTPAEPLLVTADPTQLDALTAALERAPEVWWTTGDEAFDEAMRGTIADGTRVRKAYGDLAARYENLDEPGRQEFFDTLVNAVNDSPNPLRPEEWILLRVLSGGAIRRMADGTIDPVRQTFIRDVVSDGRGLIDYVATIASRAGAKLQVGTRGATADDAVVVRGPHVDVDPVEYRATTGMEPDLTAQRDAAERVAQSPAHTIVSSENRPLARAVVEAKGGEQLPDGTRIIEVNRPDEARILQRADQEHAAAVARLEEAEAKLAEYRESRGGPIDTTIPDDEVRALWTRFMARPGEALDLTEPRTLGEMVDAAESIERGMLGDLTAAEAAQLREYLVARVSGVIRELRSRRENVSRTARTGRVERGGPRRVRREGQPDTVEWVPAAVPDELALLAQRLAPQILENADMPPLEAFDGTQYVLSRPKTKGPQKPRLFWREDLAAKADGIVPGITEELLSGRRETLPSRIDRHRLSGFIDMVAGGRPERVIRAQAIEHFKSRLLGAMVDMLDPVAYRAFEADLKAIYAAWRNEQETQRIANIPIRRRISLISPAKLDEIAEQVVRERHHGTMPVWWEQKAMTPSRAWRAADNRLRNWLVENTSFGEALDELYESKAALAASGGARGLTVWYHVLRFIGDVRWLALELTEAPMLTLGRGGMGAVLEAMDMRKPIATPYLFGKAALEKAREEWAHWMSLTDTGLFLRLRERHLMAMMKREQPGRLRDAMLDMAQRDPELAAGLRRFGMTPDEWLRRLDRDWQLLERRSTTLTPAEAQSIYKPFLDDKVINQATYDKLVASRRYTPVPEIEAALVESAGDPRMQMLYRVLEVRNQELWNELAAVLIGQPDRSNLQRLLNHPLLYWPISYQIKATRWLANVLFDKAFGVDTGAGGAWVVQEVHDRHVKRMSEDPEYAAYFVNNKTLLFLAQMVLPITPFDIGVSLSPWSRMVLERAYSTIDPTFTDPYARNLFGVGPGYTYFEALPRLFHEQGKPGAILEGSPIVEIGQQFSPFKVPVGGGNRRSQLATEDAAVFGPGEVPPAGTFEGPATRFGP